MTSNIITLIIVILSTAGVIIRPFRIPEVVWAASGAILLVLTGLMLPSEAWTGIVNGTNVYLFLTGMMLLAEVAREERLFDWLAAHAAIQARGSAKRLFSLIYAVGILVTVFLSNDATAVVLTPAVAAVMKAAKIKNQLPYLLICAFTANAASFVLPISNPANLVLYGAHLPPLQVWLPIYLLPSISAITATFLLLRYSQRNLLKGKISVIGIPALSRGGKTAAIGIIATTAVLLVTSALDLPLGLATIICGILTALIVLLGTRKNPIKIIKGISWSVLPLVAGLFIIVESLHKTGVIPFLCNLLQKNAGESINKTAWGSGFLIAIASNVTNNLPSGLVAGQVLQATHTPEIIRNAILIGVDMGPNLSITGSLATILWLIAIRREGQDITAREFFKLGLLIMTIPLLAAIASLWI